MVLVHLNLSVIRYTVGEGAINLLNVKVDSIDFQHLAIIDESGQYVEYDLTKELAVNESNLLQEMLHQPAKYIYWSSMLEKIKYFQEATELELELVEAKLDKVAREQLEKPTKDSVEAYIKRTEDYQNARKKCSYYEYLSGRIQRIVKAFEQRKDMLQSYGKQLADQKSFGQGAGTRFEVTPDMNNAPFNQG